MAALIETLARLDNEKKCRTGSVRRLSQPARERIRSWLQPLVKPFGVKIILQSRCSPDAISDIANQNDGENGELTTSVNAGTDAERLDE